ncbi:hypothetical protein J8Y17_28280 (plasmid) [Bacillus cereus]|uniref:hypothetical protein n=1 Tax=Bacillus cereus TaxID=1396 RepID=UPI001B8B8A84|nr:hypothetical protein [Bacillus cereus]QUW34592.1 hypothetical protein J8Y17_28280 [Bacillus cereus]
MKEFKVEVKSINGEISNYVTRYERDDATAETLENFIVERESRFIPFGNELVNLDNVLTIKVTERIIDNDE